MEVDDDTTRADLKRNCFRSCDRDGDGFLNEAEMMTFAQYAGFNGTPHDWEEEYRKLCEEHSLDTSRGVPSAIVMQLMDDESDAGCFLTNAELRDILDMGSDVHVHEAASAAGDSEANSTADERSVFFYNGNFDKDEGAWRKVFEKAGKVEEINIFRHFDGRSRGKGIVKYAAASEAQRAMSSLNGKPAYGRDLVVVLPSRFPRSRATPFYDGGKGGKGGQIAKGMYGGKGQQMRNWWTEEDRSTPRRFGRANSWDNGHEWDEYGYDDSYDGNESFNSRDSNSANSGSRSRGGDGRTVFFGGVPVDTTCSYLLGRFRTVGKVQAFWLFTWPNGRSRGMGLVQYRTPHEAWAAVETLSGTIIDGGELIVMLDEVGALNNIQDDYKANAWARSTGEARRGGRYSKSNTKEEQNNSESGLAEPPFLSNALASYSPRPWVSWGKGSGGARFSPYGRPRDAALASVRDVDPRRSVFFANVPYEIDEEGVKELFEEIGRVRSCVLFRTANDRSRGMGVVEYMTAASAARAYLNLHGYSVDGRRLVVDEYQGVG